MKEAPTDRGVALLSSIANIPTLIAHVLRAMVGFAIAYALVRTSVNELLYSTGLPISRLLVEVGISMIAAALMIVLTSGIPLHRDLTNIRDVVIANRADLQQRAEAQRFLTDVQQSFDMAEAESELYEVAGLALRDAGESAAEILVADASNAHLTCAAVANGRKAPGCGVATPYGCPAVRNGQTLTFDDAAGLAACPRLRERRLAPGTSALCIPVSILGVPSAVLHATDSSEPSDGASDRTFAFEGVASRFGVRLGMMRAMASSRLQAETDPLTGLLNRRSMENRTRELRLDHIPYALALVDLDHFKDLNDTYGHDTGDRALRLWARAAAAVVRDDDIVARYGGEEFVIVIADADATAAAPVLHRLRDSLAERLADAPLPGFTFSAGLVDSTVSSDLAELITIADQSLMEAKQTGRDRVVISDQTLVAERTQQPFEPTIA